MNAVPRLPTLNKQAVKHVTPEARQAAEKEKRAALNAGVMMELVTPRAGCERLSKKQRQEIWTKIKGAKLMARGGNEPRNIDVAHRRQSDELRSHPRWRAARVDQEDAAHACQGLDRRRYAASHRWAHDESLYSTLYGCPQRDQPACGQRVVAGPHALRRKVSRSSRPRRDLRGVAHDVCRMVTALSAGAPPTDGRSAATL